MEEDGLGKLREGCRKAAGNGACLKPAWLGIWRQVSETAWKD